MCGGLVAVLGAVPGPRSVERLVLYNLARVNMLVVLGAMAGAVGTSIVALGPVDVAGRGLSIVAGVVTLMIGLEVLGVLAPRRQWLAGRLTAGLGRGVGALVQAHARSAPLALGSLNALLPCHLIYAFVAMAAATGSMAQGAATMLAFGLGTVPAMMAPGVAREILPRSLGPRLVRVAGACVVLVGAVTIARGLAPGEALPLLSHGHHH
jgi:hypothetical protein